MSIRHVPVVVALVLALPLVAGAGIAPSRLSQAEAPSDVAVLLAMARLAGAPIAEVPSAPVVPATALPGLVSALGERAGVTVPDESLREFAQLDPRIAGPVATLLSAISAAWDARDAAVAGLSPAEQTELAALTREQAFSSPRFVELMDDVNRTALIQGAILLVDAAESIVVPQLEEAVRQGAWPPVPVADPVGVLRLGGPGNDVEAVNRILEIDPSGDDVYYNNAGGETLCNLPLVQMRTPIAIALDFAGNDRYEMTNGWPSHGAAACPGFGMLLDYAGNDSHSSVYVANGGGWGFFRDYAGNDHYEAVGDYSAGGGFFAYFRDDAGDDWYRVGGISAGASVDQSMVGLFWERGGTDHYSSYMDSNIMPGKTTFGPSYGWGSSGGNGWFVDEGTEVDTYTNDGGPYGNDRTWTMGGASPTGHGNENSGGLSVLLAEQSGVFPT